MFLTLIEAQRLSVQFHPRPISSLFPTRVFIRNVYISAFTNWNSLVFTHLYSPNMMEKYFLSLLLS